ncbi:MAG: hypothetical protein Q9162_000406 [Coniocarpon cinnabarinum]
MSDKHPNTRSFSIATTSYSRQKIRLNSQNISARQHIFARNASWFSKSSPEPSTQTTSTGTFLPDEAPSAPTASSAGSHASESSPILDSADVSQHVPGPSEASYTNDFIGFLEHDYGIDFGLGSSEIIKTMFEYIHVYSGFPLAGSIFFTGFLTRVVMVFAQKASVETSTQMMAISPLTKPLMAKAQAASMKGNQYELQKLQQQIKVTYKDNGVKYWKFLAQFANIPIGFGCWRTFRNMADVPVAGMTTGGFAWFTDLTAPDPTFILPLMAATFQHLSGKVSLLQEHCSVSLIREHWLTLSSGLPRIKPPCYQKNKERFKNL